MCIRDRLKPDSEFYFENEDYSTITWVVLDGDAPTQEEIDAAITAVKKAESAEEESTAKAKASLLDRLGITEDEAKLLLA